MRRNSALLKAIYKRRAAVRRFDGGMEEGDIRVLQVLSSTTNYLTCDSYLEWIHDTPYGCVIRMYDFKRHLLALKRGGVSKFLRKNLILMHGECVYLLFHFDSDADYYAGIDGVDF